MIVRRSLESIGHELRPGTVDSVRGPTTPATVARLSWVAASIPRGTMNCCRASGAEVGRSTPSPIVGSVVVAGAAAVGSLETGDRLVSVPAGVWAARGTPMAITPAVTPATTARIAAPASQPRLRLAIAARGARAGRTVTGDWS